MTYCKSPQLRCDFFFLWMCSNVSLFFFFSKQAFRDKPSKILFVLKKNTCKRHKERWHSPPIKWGYIFLRPLCKHDKSHPSILTQLIIDNVLQDRPRKRQKSQCWVFPPLLFLSSRMALRKNSYQKKVKPVDTAALTRLGDKPLK